MPPSANSAQRPGLILSGGGTAFHFDPGALCLELLTTGGPGAFRRWEVLHEPSGLADFAERSRLTPTPDLAPVTEQQLRDAVATRDSLWRMALAWTAGKPLPPADVARMNQAATGAALAPAIGADGTRKWAGTPTGDQLVATLARDAVELFTGPMASRIRMCQGERCCLVYVDTSRPGRRIWCSMERCGNRSKVRAHRSRLRQE